MDKKYDTWIRNTLYGLKRDTWIRNTSYEIETRYMD